jgi:hypothetical protein
MLTTHAEIPELLETIGNRKKKISDAAVTCDANKYSIKMRSAVGLVDLPRIGRLPTTSPR